MDRSDVEFSRWRGDGGGDGKVWYGIVWRSIGCDEGVCYRIMGRVAIMLMALGRWDNHVRCATPGKYLFKCNG